MQSNEATHSECASSNASTTSESNLFATHSGDEGHDVSTNVKSGMRSFYRVFDLEAADLQQPDFEKTRHTPFEGRFPINIGVTCYVATTGETLNIPDAYSDSRFDPIVDQGQSNEFRHQSILCMPIRNATGKILGVAQLVNKLNKQPFNKNDENLFEAFAIFSGMGIENTQMFEKAVKAMAKQKVTLELLSYHASANEQEASKFAVSECNVRWMYILPYPLVTNTINIDALLNRECWFHPQAACLWPIWGLTTSVLMKTRWSKRVFECSLTSTSSKDFTLTTKCCASGFSVCAKITDQCCTTIGAMPLTWLRWCLPYLW